jgi:hypothetical protein
MRGSSLEVSCSGEVWVFVESSIVAVRYGGSSTCSYLLLWFNWSNHVCNEAYQTTNVKFLKTKGKMLEILQLESNDG